MLKKFLLFTGLLIALVIGGLGALLSGKMTLITPYPYYFNANALGPIEKELKDASEAKILIVGDRMGANISVYTQNIMEELAHNFKTPPKIYNWARPNEGLHRTLFKLKALKKIPSIVIYHGGSSELYERTFNVNDYAAINKNFDIYDDEKLISFIITFPMLSKVLYKKMDYFELGPVKENKDELPASLKMKEKELSFKMYDYELRELIDFVKDHKSNIILITTPLNLDVHPHETCAQASSNTIIEVQQEIEDLIKKGEYKSAYPKVQELLAETYSNAKSYYLLGKASMGLGELAVARDAFSKASIFDCSNWRGNAVYNAIIKNEAKKHQVMVVDFDQMMSSHLSQEGLFSDEIFPQNIFYQRMIEELIENLKKILSVND